TTKAIWDSMKKKYQGTARVQRAQRQALQKEYEMLGMHDGESVNEYFARTLTIVNKLRVCKAKIEDVDVIEKILRSMTPKFNYVVCSIEELKILDVMGCKERPLKEEVVVELGHFQYECPSKDIGTRANYMEDNYKEMLLMASVENTTGGYYVPVLRNNLLSSGQLIEKGLEILQKASACKIYHPDKGMIMEIAMKKNRWFKFLPVAQPNKETCFNSSTEDRAQIWHCRYGHLSFNGLTLLKQKEMVRGFPYIGASSRVCEDCLVGKQQRNPFPQESTWRASQVLELVHADIYGPISHLSNSNKRYMLTFIDDYSHKVFLVEKSEAFVVFKQYKNRVKKEYGLAIKGLSTDRGGEFTSHKFTNFCTKNGIRRQLTAAYAP
ncbi:retrovirus-related pol polyprotein from transposon TNT 1-94, partial [Tanacetum coccineum]